MIWCDNLTNCKETSGAEGRALFVRTNANRENPAQLRLSSLEFPDVLDVQERALHATILSRANATGFLRGCRTDVVDRHPSFPNPSLLSPLKSLNSPPIDRSPQLLFCCFLPLLLYLITTARHVQNLQYVQRIREVEVRRPRTLSRRLLQIHFVIWR